MFPQAQPHRIKVKKKKKKNFKIISLSEAPQDSDTGQGVHGAGRVLACPSALGTERGLRFVEETAADCPEQGRVSRLHGAAGTLRGPRVPHCTQGEDTCLHVPWDLLSSSLLPLRDSDHFTSAMNSPLLTVAQKLLCAKAWMAEGSQSFPKKQSPSHFIRCPDPVLKPHPAGRLPCQAAPLPTSLGDPVFEEGKVLEKTLESTRDCKEIKPVHPKGNQP